MQGTTLRLLAHWLHCSMLHTSWLKAMAPTQGTFLKGFEDSGHLAAAASLDLQRFWPHPHLHLKIWTSVQYRKPDALHTHAMINASTSTIV